MRHDLIDELITGSEETNNKRGIEKKPHRGVDAIGDLNDRELFEMGAQFVLQLRERRDDNSRSSSGTVSACNYFNSRN